MKYRTFLIGGGVGLLVGIVAIITGLNSHLFGSVDAAPDFVPEEVLPFAFEMDQKSEQILTKMLNSHDNWTYLSGNATVQYFRDGAVSQQIEPDVAVTDQWQAQTESYDSRTEGITIIVNDGVNAFQGDRSRGVFTPMDFSVEYMERTLQLLPTTLAEVRQNEWEGIPVGYPHPMGGYVAPTTVSMLVYPTEIVQGRGVFKWIEQSTYLDRAVDIVERIEVIGDSEPTEWDRLWVDVETGVILRLERYENDQPYSKHYFEEIHIDTVRRSSPVEISPDAALQGLREVSFEEYHNFELRRPPGLETP
jgi:hypothetical protein